MKIDTPTPITFTITGKIKDEVFLEVLTDIKNFHAKNKASQNTQINSGDFYMETNNDSNPDDLVTEIVVTTKLGNQLVKLNSLQFFK